MCGKRFGASLVSASIVGTIAAVNAPQRAVRRNVWFPNHSLVCKQYGQVVEKRYAVTEDLWPKTTSHGGCSPPCGPQQPVSCFDRENHEDATPGRGGPTILQYR